MIFGKQVEKFRSFFDLITFYKSVPEFVNEKAAFLDSILNYFFIIAIFFAVTLVMTLILSPASFLEKMAAYAALIAAFFFLIQIAAVLISSLIIQLLCKLYGSKVQFQSTFLILFRLVSFISMLFLVLFIPFADFAKIVLFFLGTVFFVYFLFQTLKEIYSFSNVRTALVSLVFLLVFVVVYSSLSSAVIMALSPIYRQFFGKTFMQIILSMIF